jgi:hypothetical protein
VDAFLIWLIVYVSWGVFSMWRRLRKNPFFSQGDSDLGLDSSNPSWGRIFQVDDVELLLNRSGPVPHLRLRRKLGHTSLLEARRLDGETVAAELGTGDPPGPFLQKKET